MRGTDEKDLEETLGEEVVVACLSTTVVEWRKEEMPSDRVGMPPDHHLRLYLF